MPKRSNCDDHAEIQERARRVREATEDAWRRGFVAPSDEDLTAALGDTAGRSSQDVSRRKNRRKRGELDRADNGRMPRGGPR
jgi:hypothetical protein